MSSIKLFKGVPWGSDGLNILRFPNQAAQTAYFDSLETYVPKEEINYDPRRGAVLTLQESLFDAREFNYLAWYDDNDNPLYFFIEDYEYLNDNPTVALQITEDVWQNTQFKIKINNSKVHRRHMPRWSGNTPLLYPIDEGSPRSQTCIRTQRLDDSHRLYPNTYAFLIITNKGWVGTNHADGIHYYLTLAMITRERSATPIIRAPTQSGFTYSYWLDPLAENFLDQLSLNGVAPDTINGIYIIPIFNANIVDPDVIQSPWRFKGLPDTSVDYMGNVAGSNAFATLGDITLENDVFSLELDLPQKGTANTPASWNLEPQVFSDNVRRYVLSDSSGYPLLEIPNDILWQNPVITSKPELKSLSPQLRIVVGNDDIASPANGLECVLPLPQVDVANSNWLSYATQQRAQQQSILENNISARYTQAAISLLSGAGAGAAMGGLYSESFGNPKRSPGLAAGAGAAMNVISGIGSLANAYIQAGTDRDNFKLNEQMIKNKPAPPIGGSNPFSLLDEGVTLRTFDGDDISKNIIWSQYKYAGVIVDEFMPIELRTRYYYDFIQTQNISISGNINNAQRLYLADLFNNGVTVWHSETFTGFDYNYDNIEV